MKSTWSPVSVLFAVKIQFWLHTIWIIPHGPYRRSCTTETSLQRAADSQQLKEDALTGSGEQMCAEVLDGL